MHLDHSSVPRVATATQNGELRLSSGDALAIASNIQAKKYITKRTIEEFTAPKLPAHYEDEILEAFANYSMETDMVVSQLPLYFQDLKIPKQFIIGNKRIRPEELAIKGTQVVDFDKLLVKSYQLLLFRDNRRSIEDTWKLICGKSHKAALGMPELKQLDSELKASISDTLLMDMVAVGTEGNGLDVTMSDFAYILGKLGQLLTD